MLDKAHTMSMSLITPNTVAGARDKEVTRMRIVSLERGMFVDCRTLSGIGREGVVTIMEGMARSRVSAFKAAIVGFR